MSTAIDASCLPVEGNETLETPTAIAPGRDGVSDLWAEVHKEVQDTLATLENEVRRRAKDVQVTSSRTSGTSFDLFTCKTFSMPSSTVDPVVVGITFSPTNDEVLVEADVSGEQSGDFVYSSSIEAVPRIRERLLVAARECALKLCQSSNQIVDAICDRSRIRD